MSDFTSEMKKKNLPMNVRRKYQNGLQTTAFDNYAKYSYKILVFSKPRHIAKI